MFGLGAGELLLIGVFALIFIGPKKLPELARGLGQSIREFQKAKDDFMTEVKNEGDAIENDPTKKDQLPSGVNEVDETLVSSESKETEDNTQKS